VAPTCGLGTGDTKNTKNKRTPSSRSLRGLCPGVPTATPGWRSQPAGVRSDVCTRTRVVIRPRSRSRICPAPSGRTARERRSVTAIHSADRPLLTGRKRRSLAHKHGGTCKDRLSSVRSRDASRCPSWPSWASWPSCAWCAPRRALGAKPLDAHRSYGARERRHACDIGGGAAL
jgi:hypothetical protein